MAYDSSPQSTMNGTWLFVAEEHRYVASSAIILLTAFLLVLLLLLLVRRACHTALSNTPVSPMGKVVSSPLEVEPTIGGGGTTSYCHHNTTRPTEMNNNCNNKSKKSSVIVKSRREQQRGMARMLARLDEFDVLTPLVPSPEAVPRRESPPVQESPPPPRRPTSSGTLLVPLTRATRPCPPPAAPTFEEYTASQINGALLNLVQADTPPSTSGGGGGRTTTEGVSSGEEDDDSSQESIEGKGKSYYIDSGLYLARRDDSSVVVANEYAMPIDENTDFPSLNRYQLHRIEEESESLRGG